MRKGDLFPLAYEEHIPPRFGPRHLIRVRYTGEMRPPKAGEWYIAGAIPEGWRAPGDYRTAFHIAELVKIEVTTREHVTGVIDL